MSDASVSTVDLQGRWNRALMPNYGTPPVALVRGDGVQVWDADGKEYLDFIGGIAVSSLGHAHPAVVEAVTKQVATIAHTSNLFIHPGVVELAERLVGLLGVDAKVFFANSGTEANEAALKLVKRARGEGRTHLVSTGNSFHGRTSGALALTGKAAIRVPFGPFGMDVRFVPYGEVDALRDAVSEETIAVFVEPIQGEAGVIPPPPGYLKAVRDITASTGAAFVLDEIQSGVGRTGDWFMHQTEGVVPDVLTLAKGLGGGLPIGACIGIGEFATAFAKGDHGSTFGGNPVAVAAATAVLDTIEKDDLLANVTKTGEQLARGIEAIGHPLVTGVRGRGLWLGVTLTEPVAGAVQAAAAEAGFLVNAVAPDTVRLAPPLIVTAEQIDALLQALPGVLDTVARKGVE